MTPERRKTLTDAVNVIRIASNDGRLTETANGIGMVRDDLAKLGATFVFGNTNSIRLAGVTASSTWNDGEHLLTRWAANARQALEEGEG